MAKVVKKNGFEQIEENGEFGTIDPITGKFKKGTSKKVDQNFGVAPRPRTGLNSLGIPQGFSVSERDKFTITPELEKQSADLLQEQLRKTSGALDTRVNLRQFAGFDRDEDDREVSQREFIQLAKQRLGEGRDLGEQGKGLQRLLFDFEQLAAKENELKAAIERGDVFLSNEERERQLQFGTAQNRALDPLNAELSQLQRRNEQIAAKGGGSVSEFNELTANKARIKELEANIQTAKNSFDLGSFQVGGVLELPGGIQTVLDTTQDLQTRIDELKGKSTLTPEEQTELRAFQVREKKMQEFTRKQQKIAESRSRIENRISSFPEGSSERSLAQQQLRAFDVQQKEINEQRATLEKSYRERLQEINSLALSQKEDRVSGLLSTINVGNPAVKKRMRDQIVENAEKQAQDYITQQTERLDTAFEASEKQLDEAQDGLNNNVNRLEIDLPQLQAQERERLRTQYVQSFIDQGHNAFTAQAMADGLIKKLQKVEADETKPPTFKEATKNLQQMVLSAGFNREQALETALGVDGINSIGDAVDALEAVGLPESEIQRQKENYQVEVLGYTEDQVRDLNNSEFRTRNHAAARNGELSLKELGIYLDDIAYGRGDNDFGDPEEAIQVAKQIMFENKGNENYEVLLSNYADKMEAQFGKPEDSNFELRSVGNQLLRVDPGTGTTEVLFAGEQEPAIDTVDKIKLERDFRKDFDTLTKESRQAAKAVEKMRIGLREAEKSKEKGDSINAASQSVLVTFQKLLDPTSVVRESEYARSGSGQSLLQVMEGYAQQISQGGAGVTVEGLREFVNTAEEFAKGYEQEEISFARRTREGIRGSGLEIKNILTEGTLSRLKRSDFNDWAESNGIETSDENFNEYQTQLKKTPAVSRSGGSRSFRNNNPGNLKAPDVSTAKRFWGDRVEGLDNDGFVVFKSLNDGESALRQQIDVDARRGLTLEQFVGKYAPASENNVNSYIQTLVRETGASPQDQVSSINKESLAKAIKLHEGFFPAKA